MNQKPSQTDHQALALAGMFAAATLVEQLASQGSRDKQAYQTLLESLFVQNPERPEDVYGGSLRLGFEELAAFLSNNRRKNSHAYRYVHGMLYLQKKLSNCPEMLHTIGQRLQQAQQQKQHFGIDHDNLAANLAGIYSDTLSSFSFRIQVMGEMTYLQQTRIANQIRALLLAGIRAATLWRQLGGNRWQLLFARKKLLASAERLLARARELH